MCADGSAPWRDQVVAEATSWLSTPYRHQASAKQQGTDCLGLVRGVYRALFGVEPESPPPYRASPRHWGAGEPLLDAARRNLNSVAMPDRGDVVLFRLHRAAPASHCGIMIEADRFIHAYRGRGVIISVYAAYWQRRLAGAFAFPETL